MASHRARRRCRPETSWAVYDVRAAVVASVADLRPACHDRVIDRSLVKRARNISIINAIDSFAAAYVIDWIVAVDSARHIWAVLLETAEDRSCASVRARIRIPIVASWAESYIIAAKFSWSALNASAP